MLWLDNPSAVPTSSVALLFPLVSLIFSSFVCCACDPPKQWSLPADCWGECWGFWLDLEDEARVGRERGREGWSSTPARLYTRQSEISACNCGSVRRN